MKNKKIQKILIPTLVISFFVILFVIINIFSFRVPEIRFSCESGNFTNFGYSYSPPFCVGCIPDCFAEIEVKSENGEIICHNTYKTFNVIVGVPCLELKNHKNEIIVVKYSINSSYGKFKGEITKQYG